MTTFTMKLAEIPIEVHCIYESTRFFCRDYLSDEPSVETYKITQEDIKKERENADRDGYSDSYLETLALYRKITTSFVHKNILLVHGVIMAYKGNAYMFTAKSGVGKTTHARLWLVSVPGSYILNGDKPLLKVTKDRVLACGTPWQGKEYFGKNEILPLKAIALIERGEKNAIQSISFSDSYNRFFQQCNRSNESSAMKKTLRMISEIGEKVSFYQLSCNMDPEAATVAFEGLIPKQVEK